jgi:hypothetical protein
MNPSLRIFNHPHATWRFPNENQLLTLLEVIRCIQVKFVRKTTTAKM